MLFQPCSINQKNAGAWQKFLHDKVLITQNPYSVDRLPLAIVGVEMSTVIQFNTILVQQTVRDNGRPGQK